MDLLQMRIAYGKLKPSRLRKLLRHISDFCDSILSLISLAFAGAIAYAVYHRISYGNWFGWLDPMYVNLWLFGLFGVVIVIQIAFRWETRLESRSWQTFRDKKTLETLRPPAFIGDYGDGYSLKYWIHFPQDRRELFMQLLPPASTSPDMTKYGFYWTAEMPMKSLAQLVKLARSAIPFYGTYTKSYYYSGTKEYSDRYTFASYDRKYRFCRAYAHGDAPALAVSESGEVNSRALKLALTVVQLRKQAGVEIVKPLVEEAVKPLLQATLKEVP